MDESNSRFLSKDSMSLDEDKLINGKRKDLFASAKDAATHLEIKFRENPPFLSRSLYYCDRINKKRRKNYAKKRKEFNLHDWSSELLEQCEDMDIEQVNFEEPKALKRDSMECLNSKKKRIRDKRELENLKNSSLRSSGTSDITEIFNLILYFDNFVTVDQNSLTVIPGTLFVAIYSLTPTISHKQQVGSVYRYETSKHWIYSNKNTSQMMDLEIGDKDTKNLESKLIVTYYCDESLDYSDLPKFVTHFKCNSNEYIQDNLMLGREDTPGNWFFSQIRLYEPERESLLPEGTYNITLLPIDDNSKGFPCARFRLKWRVRIIAPTLHDFSKGFAKSNIYINRLNEQMKKQKKKRKLIKSVRNRKQIFADISPLLVDTYLSHRIEFHYIANNQNFDLEATSDFYCPFCRRKSIHLLSLIFHFITFHANFDLRLKTLEDPLIFFVTASEYLNKHQNSESFSFIYDNRDRIELQLLSIVSHHTLLPSPSATKAFPYKIYNTEKYPTDITFYHSTGATKEGNSLAYDSEDEIDMAWLIEKMEFLIDKCDDISRATKRFMKLWNQYVMERKIFSDRQLATLCLEFSEKNKEMFRSRPLKMAFIVHLINLWDYSIIEPFIISTCLRIIKYNNNNVL